MYTNHVRTVKVAMPTARIVTDMATVFPVPSTLNQTEKKVWRTP